MKNIENEMVCRKGFWGEREKEAEGEQGTGDFVVEAGDDADAGAVCDGDRGE